MAWHLPSSLRPSEDRFLRHVALCMVLAAGAVLYADPSGAAEPAPTDGPLLVARLETRLHGPDPGDEPAPRDYETHFGPLPSPEDLSLLSLPLAENELRLWHAEEAWLQVDLPPEDYVELYAERPKLTTASLDANDQRSVVGGKLLVTRPWRETSRVQAETRLLWLCEFVKNGSGPTSFFSPGDSNIFVTQGLRYGSNWALLGGCLRWHLAGGLSAFAGYDAQVNSLEMFHIGSTGLRYAW